ncbi:alkaline phosphatase family protein [Streptomyces toxytricini]|uniref:Alkaline phosphatase family protein n=1 Tax=Streptomyces toxytricini TaxID=67369 RepID=A0ABW8EE06_STRT5
MCGRRPGTRHLRRPERAGGLLRRGRQAALPQGPPRRLQRGSRGRRAPAAELRDGDPDAALGEINAAGHSHGAASRAYGDAVTRVDALVGRLLAVVRQRPTHAREDGTILAATDHGHTAHGRAGPAERALFTLANGP